MSQSLGCLQSAFPKRSLRCCARATPFSAGGWRTCTARCPTQHRHLGGAALPTQPCISRRPEHTRKHHVRAAAGAASAVAAASSGGAAAIAAVVVGYLVIAGSCIRSVPQILRIVKNKSAKGLSLISIVSELAVYTVGVAYNLRFQYPFSTWGDTMMVAVQQVAIVGLAFKFNQDNRAAAKVATAVGYTAFCAFLFSNTCGNAALTMLQAASAALLVFGGRLPQIVLNNRRGNSGELSATSTGLSVAGNLARVFTTITLVKDPIILLSAATQLVLNSALLIQILDTQRRERAAIAAAAAAL